MGLLAIMVACLTDPVRLGTTVLILLCSRNPWIVLVATIASTVIAETMLNSLRFGGQWGDGLLLGLIASTIQAILCYRIIGAIRRSRKKAEQRTTLAEPVTAPQSAPQIETPAQAPVSAELATNMQPTSYDLAYPVGLGRLIADLATLEFSLRVTLYLMDTPPAQRLPSTWKYADLSVGDTMPTTWLTDWKYLSELIAVYNERQAAAGLPRIDAGISDMRNALAHGGITSQSNTEPLSLVKFGRPQGVSVRVLDKQILTLEWLDTQISRVFAACQSVMVRMDELRSRRLD